MNTGKLNLTFNYIGKDLDYKNPHFEINGFELSKKETELLMYLLKKCDMIKDFEERD